LNRTMTARTRRIPGRQVSFWAHMRTIWVTVALFVTSVATRPACAQQSTDIQNVELAAARYVSARHDGVSIRIDPVFAKSGTAPGVRTTLRRPSYRNRLLTDSLDAVISDRRTVGSVYLLLSEPLFDEQQATISVTATYPVGANRSIMSYETLELTLLRQGSRWHVERAVQLGIS